MKINGYDLVETCGACPEQYDVFKGGSQVGYLRLRHGYFRAETPDCGGVTVYSANPEGDGIFEDWERDNHLSLAIEAIDKYVNRTHQMNEDQQEIITLLDELTEDERLEIFDNYCKSCGGDRPCYCWNDE